ncbi:MAG: NAD(P)/FAD-dependent oxidoreductase [Myxococcales bacterium]|nr:NAD(P)/FAD-dependent oxidoreductase [Myxococcales bacterium]
MTELDVVIVGAGISGIGAAYHLQTRCPGKTFAILEARERLGGTWDLFRYPGIRSDSDMYTLGFSFRPWRRPEAIAGGDAILEYLRETAETFGIDKTIRFRHRVERASWSSADARWTLDVRDAAGALQTYTCSFLFACAGYYDYSAGYTPDLPGIAEYRGRVVHPQKWTEDIDFAGKRVVVIGSGATAMTLVPALAKQAAHVTMLQRSPTYVISMPSEDRVAEGLKRLLPPRAAHAATRWKNVLLSTAFYNYSKRFPAAARRMLIGNVKKAIGTSVDVDTHFTPRYQPWDQRLCLIPDGDLYEALTAGKASVVTDQIETFTATGIRLRSGEELAADLVVTATGLSLQLLGGIALEIDGERVDPAKRVLYKGVMLSGVPNLALAIGYTNASWTLKSELTGLYVCRLLQHMDRHRYSACAPRVDGEIDERPLLDLDAGYIQRGRDRFPRQGTSRPWRLYQNYVLDRWLLRRSPVSDRALQFTRTRHQSRASRREAA